MQSNNIRIALLGQPNSGKTLLINRLAGSNLRVGNFPGVTVEKTEISFNYKGNIITFIDLPGIYNFNSETSEDEKIARQYFLENIKDYDIVLIVGNCTRLDRIGHLLSTIKEIKKPKLIALNMYDLAQEQGLEINTDTIGLLLGLEVAVVSAKNKTNLNNLLEKIVKTHKIEKILDLKSYDCLEIDKIFDSAVKKISFFKRKINYTKILDKILLHKFFGLPIFGAIMFISFKLTFSLGQFPADFIEYVGDNIAQFLTLHLPRNILVASLTDGIIPGVITVLTFLPLIIIMSFCISLLEKVGYMSRITFLMDGILRKFGMQGASSFPLLTGFGCSIPAYMSTRIIPNKIEKIATLFAIGLVPCSAKMTLFILLVGTFFSAHVAPYVLFGIYIGGTFLGLLISRLVGFFIKKYDKNSITNNLFIIELHDYCWPQFSLLLSEVVTKAKSYLKNAGTFIAIMAFSIWILSHLPYNPWNMDYWDHFKVTTAKKSVSQEEMINANNYLLSNSVLGAIGKACEPVFSPLGFDWKMNIALLAAIAAKEVAISTLGVLYKVPGNEVGLMEKMRQEVPFSSGISYIMFSLIYIPCLSAVVMFKREAGDKIYLIILIVLTSVLAWVMAYIAKITIIIFS